jgi:hypothetical protein
VAFAFDALAKSAASSRVVVSSAGSAGCSMMAMSVHPDVNEAQRHLMKIAATNPFLLVQLSPVPTHLKGRRDFEAKRELEFVDADDLDSL